MVKPDVNKKRLLISLECTSYDLLQRYDTPNIDSLDPHPATSFGSTTRATIPALLGGYLPICELRGKCPKKHVDMYRKWTYSYFLTEYQKADRLFLYCPMGWVAEFITHFLRPDIKDLVVSHYATPNRTREFQMMRDNFLNRDPDSMPGYFAYFHIVETHPPYWPIGDAPPHTEEGKEERRRITYEEVDRDLKPLLDLDVDELVITADHEEHFLGTRVFLATRVK